MANTANRRATKTVGQPANPQFKTTSARKNNVATSTANSFSRTSMQSEGNGKLKKSITATKTAVSGRTKSPGATSNTQLELFFHDQLKDLYWAEKYLAKALPKMKKAATTANLKMALEDHTAQTHGQITRLEEIFHVLGKKAQAKKCEAMEGLVKEANSSIEGTPSGSLTRDVAVIMSAQKVEHYEIASYGTLVQLADTMGNTKIAMILRETLDEEKQTDKTLSALAENSINWEADSEEEEEEMMEEDEEEDEEE